MFKKYTSFVSKNRKKVIALIVVVNLLSVVSLFFISINTDFDLFIPDDSKAKEIYKEMLEYFPESDDTILLVNTKINELNKNLINKLMDFTL